MPTFNISIENSSKILRVRELSKGRITFAFYYKGHRDEFKYEFHIEKRSIKTSLSLFKDYFNLGVKHEKN